MVMACCSRCYKKFIDKDGSVDYHRLAVLLGKEAGHIVDPEELKRADEQKLIRFCKCDCHKDGESILH